jgi:hypothetical protein
VLSRSGPKANSPPADQTQSGDDARQDREIDLANRLNADTYYQQAQLDSRRAELEQQELHLRAQEDARDERDAFGQLRGNLSISDEDIKRFVLSRVVADASAAT